MKDKEKLREERLGPLRALFSIFLVYITGAVSGGAVLLVGIIVCAIGDIELPSMMRVALFVSGFFAGIIGLVLAIGESNG